MKKATMLMSMLTLICSLFHAIWLYLNYGRSHDVISKELLQSAYGKNITVDHGEIASSVVFDPEALL